MYSGVGKALTLIMVLKRDNDIEEVLVSHRGEINEELMHLIQDKAKAIRGSVRLYLKSQTIDSE